MRRVRSTPQDGTIHGDGNWTLPTVLPAGHSPSSYQENSINLHYHDHFPDSSSHELREAMASSIEAHLHDKATLLDDFGHRIPLGQSSSQSEYLSSSPSELDVRWTRGYDKTLSHRKAPLLNCQCLSFVTPANSEQCHRSAEYSPHVDQEYLPWWQYSQSPVSQGISTPGPTSLTDVCSSWPTILQSQPLNEYNPIRNFTIPPEHSEVLLSSRAHPGSFISPTQYHYLEADGWNGYESSGTSLEKSDSFCPFTISTDGAPPEEMVSSVAFSSQYRVGDSDLQGSPLFSRHTSSQAAGGIEHTLDSPSPAPYHLAKPEQSTQGPAQPKELCPKPTKALSAPSPVFKSFDWSSSPCLSDSPEYMSGICSKKNARRNTKDVFLIRSKLSGMSYREIKIKGRFKEAESTLRGRFRTLTKRKEQRVRKPQWQERDVSNLHCDAPPREANELIAQR